MIDFSKYGIKYDPKVDNHIRVNDMIALGNIGKKMVDTYVVTDDSHSISIEGKHTLPTGFAVAGGEVLEVLSHEVEGNITRLRVNRGMKQTKKGNQTGCRFRSVDIFDETNKDAVLLDWDFEDTIGNVSSNLFPCELGSGSITLGSSLDIWSPISNTQKFFIRPRKTVAYIFKGVGDNRFLRHTLVVSKLDLNSKSSSEISKVRLEVKSKMAMWYDRDLAINTQFKNTTPIDFLRQIFSLRENEIYYTDGVTSDSFIKINNLHSKEYRKISEILKAYCSNGVRFCFDSLERVKIFSDFKVSNIPVQKTIYEDVVNPSLTTNEQMVYNTINTESSQRLPMYNFEDMGNKYVNYACVLPEAVSGMSLMKRDTDGSYTINMVEILNYELSTRSTMGDIVCFKQKYEPHLEVFAKVIDITPEGKVMIYPITTDKDIGLFANGKGKHIYDTIGNDPNKMTLYYARQELPIVGKLSRNRQNKEIDSSLMYPLLPKVDGAIVHVDEKNYTFGCASNIKIGKYTGIVEEIGSIFGSWDSTFLKYNKEVEQFNGQLPPIFVLSNKVTERAIPNAFIMDFTHFDNSDLMLKVEKPRDGDSDLTVKMHNNINVNSNIDLYTDSEISRLGDRILSVTSKNNYRVGDVLVLKKPDDLTAQEEREFDEVLSTIKWVVNRCNVENGRVYIELDSNFAKRHDKSKKYEYVIYPNWSIVYVQELYFRGNPVIEYTQNVTGVAKGVNYDGDRSIDIYGEKKYSMDSKQLNKEGMTMLMGYVLDHCQATTLETTKMTLPISSFNGIDIELLDVVTIIEPTYTKITENIKWVVISIKSKAKSNVVELKLLNLNTTDTKPFKINIKDMLEYIPVEVPTYNPTGNEGAVGGGDNNGDGGEGFDPSVGTFQTAVVDPQIFKAKVEKVEGKFIYFDGFGGTEWETYVGKLFPTAEFGVVIQGESILVKADSEYRAFIRKRDIYNNDEQVEIKSGDDVTFLTMSYYVDIDGKFHSRSCKIGDDASYFEYDIDKGAKFVGDFVVGSNNQNAGNDLWESLQKNKTFQQHNPPSTDYYYTLRSGDIWYDTDDENHMYRYSGTAWVSCRDGSITTAGSSSFVQPNIPVDKPGRPLRDGDTWYDSDDAHKAYIYRGGEWICVSDTSLSGLVDKALENSNKAMVEIAKMADDNLISPMEKSQLRKEWEIIFSEYPKLVEECNKFGVTFSEYTLIYNRLRAYLFDIFSDMSTPSGVDGEDVRKLFSEYYSTRQEVLNKISSAIVGVGSMQNGKMLYIDPTFKKGLNECKVYNNANNGIISLSQYTPTESNLFPPNDSKTVLRIRKGSGVASPGCGGFFWGVPSKQGLKLLTKIVAWIPIGYKLVWTTNAVGNNSKNYWVTDQKGGDRYIEYVHVLECGDSGSFASTGFFYITSIDSNYSDTAVLEWFLAYATCFDSTSNSNEYVTEALGNSKIYHSTTAPLSGMKLNDMWYDTDDGNHPYIYNGSLWVSARDKIFEANGVKIYFQNAQPPSSGEGTKTGDMWFKTDSNNALYMLFDGYWRLADDALDKVNNGRIVLNGNTTVNGSFKVSGGSVELDGNTSITGSLSMYGDKGVISYNGWNEVSSTKRTILTAGGILFQQKL
ncbi:MAG: hypothetical protein ACRCZ0_08300 [Cetobacterium sp.]